MSTSSSGGDHRIVILGAGVVGLSTAYHLVQRGADNVTVVEATHVAAGSSSLSVGMVETQFFDAVDVHSRALGRELVDRLVVDHELHFVRNGFMRPATTFEHLEAFERSVDMQRRFGIEDATVLTTDEVAAMVPPINADRVLGGLWRPSDGYLDGYLFASLLAQLVVRHGGRVAQQHRLRSAERQASGTWTLGFEQRPDLEADVVVNATGPWAEDISAMFGAQVAVKPERHQAVTIELGAAPAWRLPCVVEYVPGSIEDGLSLRHEGDRQLFACLHNERSVYPRTDPAKCDARADESFVDAIVELVVDRFPGLGDCGIGHGWAGLYPMTPDGYPIVGALPGDDTFVQAVGGGGSGIQLAAAMGAVAADWVVDGKSDLLTDGHLWAPDRFDAR